jgi:hypothetical protein
MIRPDGPQQCQLAFKESSLLSTCTIDEPCSESVWRIDPPPFDGTDDDFLIVGAIRDIDTLMRKFGQHQHPTFALLIL